MCSARPTACPARPWRRSATFSRRVAVRLAELDAFLRDVHGIGLTEVIGPYRDRPGERSREAAGREAVLATAIHALLGCRAPAAVIRWRNDFDWTGVRLTAAALARYPDAVPWRRSGADYLAADGAGPPLAGAAAATPWDPSLARTMTDAGRSVMEERLISTLLADLTTAALDR